jgi:hypothetical protein
MTSRWILWPLALVACLLTGLRLPAQSALPAGPASLPVAADHFPSPAHAVIWRNWFLVPPARLAEVLGAGEDEIQDTAEAMGLPREPRIDPGWSRQGYITIVRRNWHLLPYEQLLPLIGMAAEEFAFALREDDFLFFKLGNTKPACAPVKLAARDAATRAAEAAIRATVVATAGAQWQGPEDPPFSFIKKLGETSGRPLPVLPADWRKAPPRYIYSYFGSFGDPLADASLDPYPDGLLEKLAAEGANGVWLHVVLRQLAPGGAEFPEFGHGHEKRLEELRNIVARAARYGIQVYLYLNEPRAMPVSFFFGKRPGMAGVEENGYRALCSSDAEVRKWLGDAAAHVFREVPGLGGAFTISASENLTHCASHHGHSACPRCSLRDPDEIIAEANASIEEGVHRSAPDARFFAWDWGWRNHGQSPEIISRLTKDTWLLSVSEWDAPFERGGVKGNVGEYSLSVPGPGPRALAQWKSAREAGLQVAAKVQLNTTWELASVPWLPVGDLVARHCEALVGQDVSGLMLSWSLGGHPSPNLRIAQRFFEPAGDGAVDREAVLLEVAAERYGAMAAPQVREAWQRFSAAFLEYPYNGGTLYSGPQHMGPANLPHPAATGHRASMVCFPYDDLEAWRGPYPAEVFATQFELLAKLWNEGIAKMEAAVETARTSQAPELGVLSEDLVLARAAGIHFGSVAAQTRFVLARDRWLADPSPARKEDLQSCYERLAASARDLFPIACSESRIGFEASNHYFFTPHDLLETLIAVEWQLQQLAGK